MFCKIGRIYLSSSFLSSAAILVFLILKKDKALDALAVKILAILTALIHYSPLWVDYLTTGSALVKAEMLFAIYPCHICMWLLIISAFTLKRTSLTARLLRSFTALGGVVCGTVGLIFNENFIENPTLSDFYVLKGLLSHSTMILGCLILATAGFASLRMKDSVLSTVSGLLLFFIDGTLMNLLFDHFGLPSLNAMYLEKPPFPAMPFINTATIGAAAITVSFIIGVVYEQLALKKEERWYSLLKAKFTKADRECSNSQT